MKNFRLPIIFLTLSLGISLAIYGTYHRYNDLRDTMEIQNSIFQLVELKSANTEWEFELNRIHTNNFPHFDEVNHAARKYEHEMAKFLRLSASIQGPLQTRAQTLLALSLDKKEKMKAYLSEIAVTRNSLKYLDTLLFTLHIQYKNDPKFIAFLTQAQYQLSMFIALNQNIVLKQHFTNFDCRQCSSRQSEIFETVNLHLEILRSKIALSNDAKNAFYNPEHSQLTAHLFDDLSQAYTQADSMHQTIQSQIITITLVLVITVIALLSFLYLVYRTIEGHRRAGITDPLTGLFNRKKLFDNLQVLMDLHEKSDKSLALLFIDLDGFKNVNDTHGHDIGDKLLQRISARFNQHIRKQDCIYRIGGDEFVILVKELENLDIAEAIAKEMLIKCSKPYKLDNIICDITLSIGISYFPDHTRTPIQLIRHADEAMYQAKSRGKNQVKIWQGII